MNIDQLTDKMKKLNKGMERFMPFLTPTGVILGLILGRHIAHLKPAVTYLFMFLTFTGAISISIKDFGRTLKKPSFLAAYAILSYLIMPLIAKLGAISVFPNSPDTVSGYVLLRSIPSAVTGTIWATIYSGNMAICLSILILDTLIAPLMTPFLFSLYSGATIKVDFIGMLTSMFTMVVIPSIIGMIANQYKGGKINKHVGPCLKPISKIALLFVLMINTAQVSDRIIANASFSYITIALSSLGITILGFVTSYFVNKAMKFNREDSISITFSVAMRNISAALVLAIDYLPPAAALPCIFGIVFQQSICAIMGSILFKKKDAE